MTALEETVPVKTDLPAPPLLSLPDSAQLPRKRWTRDEFLRLVEEGFLNEDTRYELIEGEIIAKMGQGRKHILICMRLIKVLAAVFGFDCIQSRSTLPVNLFNAPEPDTAVLDKPLEEYVEVEPGPQNVRLVVEVSDSSLDTDRDIKSLVYARADVVEYWIVNVKTRKLEVYRQPTPDGYAMTMILSDDQVIHPVSAPEASIRVADVLP